MDVAAALCTQLEDLRLLIQDQALANRAPVAEVAVQVHFRNLEEQVSGRPGVEGRAAAVGLPAHLVPRLRRQLDRPGVEVDTCREAPAVAAAEDVDDDRIEICDQLRQVPLEIVEMLRHAQACSRDVVPAGGDLGDVGQPPSRHLCGDLAAFSGIRWCRPSTPS